MMGFWNAVASAGPHANNLHLAPDRQPHQHLITQFLQAECSSWHTQTCQNAEGKNTQQGQHVQYFTELNQT